MIGTRIKQQRKHLNMFIQELSDLIRKPVDHINDLEEGKVIPDSQELIALSRALKVRTEYFFRPNIIKTFEIKHVRTH